VIKFGESIELCGGTHTPATGNIGIIKITTESAIAAGVRRIEAVTGKVAEEYLTHFADLAEELKLFFNSPNIMQSVQKMAQQNELLLKEIESFQKEKTQILISQLEQKVEHLNNFNIIREVSTTDPDIMKQVAYNLRNKFEKLLIVLGSQYNDKPNLVVALSDDLLTEGYHASNLIREAAILIQGGGGGQPSLATAGGKNCNGLEQAVEKVVTIVLNK
jgi:alanyl-tRNA synthetase